MSDKKRSVVISIFIMSMICVILVISHYFHQDGYVKRLIESDPDAAMSYSKGRSFITQAIYINKKKRPDFFNHFVDALKETEELKGYRMSRGFVHGISGNAELFEKLGFKREIEAECVSFLGPHAGDEISVYNGRDFIFVWILR